MKLFNFAAFLSIIVPLAQSAYILVIDNNNIPSDVTENDGNTITITNVYNYSYIGQDIDQAQAILNIYQNNENTDNNNNNNNNNDDNNNTNDDETDANTDTDTNTNNNNNNDVMNCEGVATYMAVYRLNWIRTTTPRGFPGTGGYRNGGAHFSEFVGASHNSKYNMWNPEESASNAIRKLAEEGDYKPLVSDLEDAKDDGNVLDMDLSEFLDSGVGESVNAFEVDNSRSFFSSAGMIAPSPDWFLGVADVELCDRKTGKWKQVALDGFPLYAYDAGTDAGLSFDSDNKKMSPFIPIFRLTGENPDSSKSAFYGRDERPFGDLTIVRVD
eukprot:Pgem_evm1s2072